MTPVASPLDFVFTTLSLPRHDWPLGRGVARPPSQELPMSHSSGGDGVGHKEKDRRWDSGPHCGRKEESTARLTNQTP